MIEAFLYGVVLGATLLFIAWSIWTELRLRSVQSELNEEKVKSAYGRLKASTKTLSDAELDALDTKFLSRSNSNPSGTTGG